MVVSLVDPSSIYATDVKDLRKQYRENMRGFFAQYKNERYSYTGVCSGLTKRDGENNYILGVSSSARILFSKSDVSDEVFKALQKLSRSPKATSKISFSAVMNEERGGVFYFTELNDLKLTAKKNSNKQKKTRLPIMKGST
jgi:hypothetical protein